MSGEMTAEDAAHAISEYASGMKQVEYCNQYAQFTLRTLCMQFVAIEFN